MDPKSSHIHPSFLKQPSVSSRSGVSAPSLEWVGEFVESPEGKPEPEAYREVVQPVSADSAWSHLSIDPKGVVRWSRWSFVRVYRKAG